MRNSNRSEHRVALITGAGGGMGAACSRSLGRRYRLVLTEFHSQSLAAVVSGLRHDGVEVIGQVVGDISAAETIPALMAIVEKHGGLDALVHTAGISPKMGSWEVLLNVNLGATLHLLDAVEARLLPRSAAVLIASLAGQMFHGTPAIDAMLRGLDGSNLTERLAPLVRERASSPDPLSLSVAAYGVSKYAVSRLCEERAQAWGKRGARLVSISPGLISTSMGLLEANGNPAAAGLAEQAPVGRWGTPLDIADGRIHAVGRCKLHQRMRPARRRRAGGEVQNRPRRGAGQPGGFSFVTVNRFPFRADSQDLIACTSRYTSTGPNAAVTPVAR